MKQPKLKRQLLFITDVSVKREQLFLFKSTGQFYGIM